MYVDESIAQNSVNYGLRSMHNEQKTHQQGINKTNDQAHQEVDLFCDCISWNAL